MHLRSIGTVGKFYNLFDDEFYGKLKRLRIGRTNKVKAAKAKKYTTGIKSDFLTVIIR